MAKNLILVNTNADILKYDNRKAIELAQTLGRPLTRGEYESLKIKKMAKLKKTAGTCLVVRNTKRDAGK